MAGINNDVLYGLNVDFSGGHPVVGKVTADGQLLIGSTASPYIKVATLTAGTNIGVVNASGSITVAFSGILPVSSGGTGASTLTGILIGNGTSAIGASTVTQYGMVVAGASNTVSSIAPSATSGVPLISQGAAANPAYGTVVVAGGGTGAVTLTDGGILLGSGTNAITATAQPTDGQLLIGDTGTDPVLASLTAPAAGFTITGGAGTITFALANDLAALEALAGTGIAVHTGASTWTERSIIGTSPIVVTNGNGVSGNPTVSVTGGGLPWTVVTGASQAAAVNSGYICNRGAGVTVTLPDTAAVGSILRIAGMDGNWVLAQNAGETIYFGTSATTTGAGGSLTATDNRDCIELVCTVADQDWVVTSSVGNITVT